MGKPRKFLAQYRPHIGESGLGAQAGHHFPFPDGKRLQGRSGVGIVGERFGHGGEAGQSGRPSAPPRRWLQFTQAFPVAGVVGDHQHEFRLRLDRFRRPVQEQLATVIRKRMDCDHGVGAGLGDLIQVDDGVPAHAPGQRAVAPFGIPALEQMPDQQIRGRGVLVAGDGYQRPLQPGGHVFDEPGLAATRRSFEHQRQPVPVSAEKDFLLLVGGQVIRDGGSGIVHFAPSHLGVP